ncbi:MAG: 2-oxoacid:acceptor oxidoreductase family protein [Planctomycetota bacterium]
MAKEMFEILWHGRGGQGAKTAATMVAHVALNEGKYSQGFPEYGPERMGAPVRGYTRISDQPITVHCGITKPDAVIVLDSTLLNSINVLEGTNEQVVVVINTPLSPQEVIKKYNITSGKLYTCDATKIAREEIGRPTPNTPMIGAFLKATDILNIESFKKDIEKKFGTKFGKKIVAGNIRALQRAYEETLS